MLYLASHDLLGGSRLVIMRTLSMITLYVAGTVQTKMNDYEKNDDNCGDHYKDANGCVDKNTISDGEV